MPPRFKFATIYQGQGNWYVFLSDLKKKMDICSHQYRHILDTEKEAMDDAVKWTKPKQGKINLLTGYPFHPKWTPIKG